MRISLDGFVAGPDGEMNWVKVDKEIFDHVGKRISESSDEEHELLVKFLAHLFNCFRTAIVAPTGRFN